MVNPSVEPLTKEPFMMSTIYYVTLHPCILGHYITGQCQQVMSHNTFKYSPTYLPYRASFPPSKCFNLSLPLVTNIYPHLFSKITSLIEKNSAFLSVKFLTLKHIDYP